MQGLYRVHNEIQNPVEKAVIFLIYTSHSGPHLIHSVSYYFILFNVLTHSINTSWFRAAIVPTCINQPPPPHQCIKIRLTFSSILISLTPFFYQYRRISLCTSAQLPLNFIRLIHSLCWSLMPTWTDVTPIAHLHRQ